VSGVGRVLTPRISWYAYQHLAPAVLRCERQGVSTAEDAELWGEGMEPLRTQVLSLDAIRRPSRFRHEFLACRSAAVSTLCVVCALCGDWLSTRS
jgi:hypothetical protein